MYALLPCISAQVLWSVIGTGLQSHCAYKGVIFYKSTKFHFKSTLVANSSPCANVRVDRENVQLCKFSRIFSIYFFLPSLSHLKSILNDKLHVKTIFFSFFVELLSPKMNLSSLCFGTSISSP